ncbi:uroporphyrinogen-III synthase [Halalkalibacterium ligniniphilum]|uniref:uroporphyrinogen-III synthase n=1 Tax=Halalkalibacterium ligniniphilum TaxID=1134413 RepID=UPI00034B88F1|nr:uroporphyrinogen-III synthase [Halalkalibacterium ligniniphilum]
MAQKLAGKRVAIAGSRKTEEMSTLIEKQGGTAFVRPLQGTVFLAQKEIEPKLKQFVEHGADWVIFTTGIGTDALFNFSEQLGVHDQFLNVLHDAKIASRGYKTLAALKKRNIKPLVVDEDGTMNGLMEQLKKYDFSSKRIMVQLHGVSSPVLRAFFNDKGATVTELLPYQHIAPDEKTIEQLLFELMNDKLDALCFTTAIQVRSLFDYARNKAAHGNLLTVFKNSVVAVSVGKVTTEALRDEGVERIVAPEHERMGAMIMELARYYGEKKQ